jgi:predicted  nucleic acid-binding Zn-ribbon protein
MSYTVADLNYELNTLRMFASSLAERVEKLERRTAGLEDELESRVAEIEQALADRARR